MPGSVSGRILVRAERKFGSGDLEAIKSFLAEGGRRTLLPPSPDVQGCDVVPCGAVPYVVVLKKRRRLFLCYAHFVVLADASACGTNEVSSGSVTAGTSVGSTSTPLEQLDRELSVSAA